MLKYHNIFLLSLFGIMFFQMLGFGIYLRIRKISMAGIPPVHPILFKTAKAAMMLCWVVLFVKAAEICNLSSFSQNELLTMIAIVFFGIGVLLQLLSYVNLGKNLKFGIPDGEEQKKAILKVTGLYSFSRNPMYVGFFLMTIASCLYVLNPLIWALSLFTLIVHHLIALKEEKFLKQTFGEEWFEYSKKVRRYV